MKKQKAIIDSVDEYIKQYPLDIQLILNQIRSTIRKAAPKAIERISYQMPTYSQNGNLVYFAAHKNHIGLYPMAKAIVTFSKELSPYKIAKGSIQFPIDKQIPLDIIKKIVLYRIKENEKKQLSNKK